MGLFKSKRKETEDELLEKLKTMDPNDPGYENVAKAVSACNDVKSDRKGTIIGACIAGGMTILGIVIENLFLGHRQKEAYQNEEVIVTSDAGKQALRDGLRHR